MINKCSKTKKIMEINFNYGAISFSHPDGPSKKMIVHPLLKEMVNGRLDGFCLS